MSSLQSGGQHPAGVGGAAGPPQRDSEPAVNRHRVAGEKTSGQSEKLVGGSLAFFALAGRPYSVCTMPE